MHFIIYLRQLFRKPIRIILYLLTIALSAGFFCMSANLYWDSVKNLQLADDAFSTIAVLDYYADVDWYGKIVENFENVYRYAGEQRITRYGVDLQQIVNAPYVKNYDLRSVYGAFSDEHIALNHLGQYPIFNGNVIRFTISREVKHGDDHLFDYSLPANLGEEPFTIQSPYDDGIADYYLVKVSHAANDIYGFDHPICFYLDVDRPDQQPKEIFDLNGDVDPAYGIIIEPETEYIGISESYAYYDENIATDASDVFGHFRLSDIIFCNDRYYDNRAYYYSQQLGEYTLRESTGESPFWLYRYETVASNPELLKKYENISRAYYINAHSFCVNAINDLTGVPAFHSGSMYIRSGRTFAKSDYDAGTNVCLVSKDLAMNQGWNIGDKINFSFYNYKYFTQDTDWNTTLIPYYTYTENCEFFDNGTYEIIGIYDATPTTSSEGVRSKILSVPWNTIYIPEKSLENAPAEEDRPVTGALLTIWLENGKIEPFIERMNELGITGAKQGDYEARFTFYDQGYSRIQPSLEALSGTAELLLILSSSLLAIAALLLAFFYAQSQKQSIGTMRLLGCSKARAFVAVMLSALIIAVTGALIGAAIGHALTASVGESIMANANQTPEEFLAFSAYLAESTQVEVEFALGADAKVSLLTCLAALGLFIAGTLVFVIRYLGKGPRELLPRAGE